MNDADRGMIKWAPYKSLVEQSPILARMRYEKGKRPRPQISSDRAREINEVLVTYGGEEVDAEYYEDGYRHHIQGVISEISALFKYIVIGERKIGFKDLLDLSSNEKTPIGAFGC